MPDKIKVSSFYRFNFISKDILSDVVSSVRKQGQDLGLMGLVLLGTEGINGTVSGTEAAVSAWESYLNSHTLFHPVAFKNSYCDLHPFRRWKVKTRPEIVTIGDPTIVPKESEHNHLSPEEWNRLLKEERENIVLLDTRNAYETTVGKFKGAIAPEIGDFRHFPQWVAQNNIDKNKKVLIYCTGGIRCEKAIYSMEKLGFENVYQLQGGILSYLEKFPHQEFEGECFVFDRRLAVDQNLQPTLNFSQCPHCGQPATERIDCDRCDRAAAVCSSCKDTISYKACSKNCAHHLDQDPKSRGNPQRVDWKLTAPLSQAPQMTQTDADQTTLSAQSVCE